jgi:hypothetical protein
VEVENYFTEFLRQGPYPYQVCSSLPGEIGLTEDVATARCIPVEAGELDFCGEVGYDVCMRVGLSQTACVVPMYTARTLTVHSSPSSFT